jgi:hypothetical protein
MGHPLRVSLQLGYSGNTRPNGRKSSEASLPTHREGKDEEDY